MGNEISCAIGERRRGREIGKSPGNLFEYQACIDCGERRWVQCIHGKPGAVRCPSCSQIWSAALHPHKRKPHSLETKQKISRSKRGKYAERCNAWAGGHRHLKSGYIESYVSKDDFFYPMVTHNVYQGSLAGYVMEHRLVMARHLKRCLFPWEIVHHRNGIRSDNRIENLKLLKCQAEHMPSIHAKQTFNKLNKRIRDLEDRVTRLEAESCLLKTQFEAINV